MSYVLLPRLISELPALGGWPEWAHECVLHNGAQKVMFYDENGRFSHQPKFPQIEFDKESDVEISVSREAYEATLASSKKEWDGEGLPPVGMEIEYKFTKVNYRTDFSRGKVLAYGMHNVFMEHWSSKNEFIQQLDKIEFRPIRSEADKKRDEAAKGLIEYLDTETDIDNVFSIKDVIGFYDAIAAGKIPHIRIE